MELLSSTQVQEEDKPDQLKDLLGEYLSNEPVRLSRLIRAGLTLA
jgi:hypothetical protein